MAVCWSMWILRSRVIFKNENSIVFDLVWNIKALVYRWSFICIVRVTLGKGEVESHIISIVKPYAIDFDNLDANEEIVWDAWLLERVFIIHIFIVKSISLKCRLAFSQAMKDALFKVLRSGNQKALQQHHILACLNTWRDVNGLSNLVVSVLGSSEQETLGHEGVHIDEGDAKVSSNVKQCLCKVADGHFTTLVKVLGSSGVAPYNAHTMKALEAKHPVAPQNLPSHFT
ncbi:unnamed protein product [Vicia faba]|uniref:Uncharacterized protein n=1 Tax=Vicia faba TaxID=3906 RepID=A0AAV1BAZ6_VICFA|nr:unnamed protein product [Vicia faba]